MEFPILCTEYQRSLSRAKNGYPVPFLQTVLFSNFSDFRSRNPRLEGRSSRCPVNGLLPDTPVYEHLSVSPSPHRSSHSSRVSARFPASQQRCMAATEAAATEAAATEKAWQAPEATLRAALRWDEDGDGRVPAAMAFNTWHPRYSNHLACVSTNMERAGGEAARPVDATPPTTGASEPNAHSPEASAPHARGVESYTAVAWMVDEEERVLVAAGGELGVVRILDFHSRCHFKTLMGQGGAVTDLCAHPSQPSILLSASKDTSVWVWHVGTGVCCAILLNLHRAPVLSVDVSGIEGTTVVTAGEDGRVAVWDLTEQRPLMRLAAGWEGRPSDFPTKQVALPGFVAARVHWAPVQQVAMYGGLFVTMCTAGAVQLWRWISRQEVDIKEGTSQTVLHLHTPPPSAARPPAVDNATRNAASPPRALSSSPPRPPRFAMTATQRFIALRSGTSEVKVLKMADPSQQLSLRPPTNAPITAIALSLDASIVVCCCADGYLYRWDVSPPLDDLSTIV
ncbi:unnamed protein product, partial [Closterium sp. Yama58-4]